jgi:phage repressor protein C with HTH and peptisase S24 domain
MITTLSEQSFMQSVSILGMSGDDDRARKAFAKFILANKPKLSGRKVSELGGLSPSAASQFIRGNSQSPKNDTLNAFALGASVALGRPVTVAEMIGEKPSWIEIPVTSYVGAGDEIFPIGDGGPLYYLPAPPELEGGEATEVRGRSMFPMYRERDVLFHKRIDVDPSRFYDDVVVCQVKGGARYVKLLTKGSRKGRYNLVSVNPAYDPLEDQVLLWVAQIEWVKKRGRSR